MAVENFREALRKRLRELGLSAREASRQLGRNLGYVGDIIEGRSKNPDADEVLRLAELLDMDAADLLGDSMPESRRHNEAPPRTLARMLPLYAAPLPINRQFVPFFAEPVGRVPAPPMLLDVADASAAVVPNNASAPRYFAGETVFLNPAATPAPGDFVLVQRDDDSVAIARLADMGAESFKLDFMGLEGAEAAAEIAYSEVRTIKKIVASAV
jgi:transcriptional regulator with XRE-family HTH domain